MRPFLFRLATGLGFTGSVCNSSAGVELELQGADDRFARFEQLFQANLPPLAAVIGFSRKAIQTVIDETGFSILPSHGSRQTVHISPDCAICPACLQELSSSTNRRYRHPFITCTDCGPRWSIVTGTPYDRPLTTMAGFPLCPDCDAEYRNPADRRFHAQPIACHCCGPALGFIPHHPQPLYQAVSILKDGGILAVKGLGGFHLAVDACNDLAVERLRRRKNRDEKPFAVMVRDIEAASCFAVLSDMEIKLLTGLEAPVVIVRKSAGDRISDKVAPGGRWIGLMLPYTPLHQLLFSESGLEALVMTSANRAGEPMLIDDAEVTALLADVADGVLTHNRPIHIRTDDSVIRSLNGRPLFYRRSRGYVPRPVLLPFEADGVLAVGGELKSTVCLTHGNEGFLSQHIGDLKNAATFESFRQSIDHLARIMEIRPTIVACDSHPDYLSGRYAERSGLPVVHVQHHHAHFAACMAENRLQGELIGLILDGTGLGDDGTIWGGEFLVGGYGRYRRVGHIRQVRLPGGDLAAREPWRMLISWLYPAVGDRIWQLDGMPGFGQAERSMVITAMQKGVNSPFTSSAGRLFDAAAFLLGAGLHNSFDGQAAMSLEALAETAEKPKRLPYRLLPGEPFQLDFSDTLLAMLQRLEDGGSVTGLALGFHHAVAEALLAGCRLIRNDCGYGQVALSGGVFQNRLLTELVCNILEEDGFEVFTHRLVPPNDGGLSLGQAVVAAYRRADA